MPKRSIRSQLLEQRKSMAVDVCLDLSVRIQQKLIDSKCFRRAESVALYSSISNEVSTDSVAMAALGMGKRIAYPRVNGDAMDFIAVASIADMAPGAYGVLEPPGDSIVAVADLDLVVVPGIAFDTTGHRLGFGRGYYDRVLGDCREDCTKVGFAYDFQVRSELPYERHDRAVTLLMTEKRLLDFTPVDAASVRVH